MRIARRDGALFLGRRKLAHQRRLGSAHGKWANTRKRDNRKSSPLKNPSQTSSAMFADHMVLEGVEERARTTCNQARKNAIQRSSQRRL